MKKVLLLLLGVGLLGAISYFCFLDKVEHIRRHILADVQHRLDENGASWAKVKLKGEGLTATRELVLEGNAPNVEAIQDAMKLAMLDKGVLKVVNQATLISQSDTPKVAKLKESLIEKVRPGEENASKVKADAKEKNGQTKAVHQVVLAPSRIEVIKDKKGLIYLKGLIPDLKSSNELVSYAKQQFGDTKVNSELTMGTDISGVSLKDVKSAIDALKETKSGEFHLLDHNITFHGEVESDEKKEKIETSLRKAFSHGYHLVSKLHTTPKMKPLDVAKIIAEMMPKEQNNTAVSYKEHIAEENKSIEPSLKEEAHQIVAETVSKEKKDEVVSHETNISDENQTLETVVKKENIKEVQAKTQKENTKEVQADCQTRINDLLKKEKIHFDYNKAHIQSQSYALLDKIAEVFKSCSQLHLLVAGHTDSDGSEAYNLKLSQKRADAVKGYLVKKGLDSDHLVSLGYGEFSPLVANNSAKNKARNRRIEFHIVKAEDLKKFQDDQATYRAKLKSSKVVESAHQKVEESDQQSTLMMEKHLRRCQNIINRILSQNKIYFTLSRKSIEPSSRKTARDIARLIKLCPYTQIIIQGYTDSIGTEKRNLEISRQKAETLKRFLVSQGVDAKRIKAVGLGESNPLGDNETVEGRAKNRRVEIIIKEMK